jgi:hypothetical protein
LRKDGDSSNRERGCNLNRSHGKPPFQSETDGAGPQRPHSISARGAFRTFCVAEQNDFLA